MQPFFFSYISAKTIWHNNDFPDHDPLHNFKPVEHGFFNYGSLTAAKDPAGGSHNVIKVYYKHGTYSGTKGYKGAQFYSHPTSHTAMGLSYQVYFSHGFDFVKGGKLPGLAGGDEADCSGGNNHDTCFSARLMWRANGDGEVYSYFPDQAHGFCDRKDVECSNDKGISLGRGSFRFKTGEWNRITEYVHLNTVGKSDGYVKLFFNGKLVYTGKDIKWRVKDSLKINSIFFSTFFGGGSKEWAASKDCYSYFKDFILSMGSEPPLIG
ncbi:hypothetical protein SNE40_015785 [Patella caerulea]|uniref:Polysaccharide lyase 14 domain-containing protein n=1 Tax=Patella caerulea TaxID=87958 RepID=A0AAN8JHR8_PATCE